MPEPQVLEDFDVGPFWGEHRLLPVKCGSGNWILATPQLDVYLEDLQEDDMSVVPLGRFSLLPTAGRPIQAFRALTDMELAELRTRSRDLARVMGVSTMAALVTHDTDTHWTYADPAEEEFPIRETCLALTLS